MWLFNNEIIRQPKPITANGVQHPASIFTTWTESELNAIGIYTFVEEPKPAASRYTSVERVINKDVTPPTISYVVTDLDVEALKQDMVRKINEHAKRLLDNAVSKYSSAEMASWTLLEAEAKEFLASGTAGEMLSIEATVSGKTTTDLANEIIASSTAYKQLRSKVAGERHKRTEQVKAMTTIAEIQAYEATPTDGIDEITGEPITVYVDMCTHNWL